MKPFDNKLVAVMNKSVEPGMVMNALAHMCIGFGAHIGEEALLPTDYQDAEGKRYPHISRMPFIILRANSNKIRNLVDAAEAQGIKWAAFTDTMTEGTWEEQVVRTKEKLHADHTFYGVVLFGDWDSLSELTRKFSLWK